MSPYAQYVKPQLSKLLHALGLDVAYTRASANTLYYAGSNGEEVPVLDLLGGYGSTILGHHHPAIVAKAKELLDAQVPVHAQFSMREKSGELAARLNAILQRELGSEASFVTTFANSGAEAVEVAVKHAEFERIMKLDALLDEVTFNIEGVRSAIDRGEATIPPDIYRHAPFREQVFDVQDADQLLAHLVNYNVGQLAKRPVFLVLERSFHGKLIGSVQLTWNKNFRRPFQYFGLNTRFVSPGDVAQLERIVSEERLSVYDLAVEEGIVRIVERELPVFSAFLVEPIQGEGGVHCLDPEFARAIRRICNQLDCPLIIDEIQSGMGRAGSFLASTQIPLKGDYYTLSKSLGGGLAKISATMVSTERYRKEFGLVHSSTFAEDDFSSAIALQVLDLLEADGGKAYRMAQTAGAALHAALDEVRKEFPDVIREVRGKGLFLGVEFQPQDAASSTILRGSVYADSFGYLLASYLLREEGIRIAPTGSASRVLRFEPSIFLDDKDIAKVRDAFMRLCRIIRCNDALHLVHPLVGGARAKPRSEVVDFRNAYAAPAAPASRFAGTRPARKIAFLNHIIAPQDLPGVDPSLAGLLPSELREFILRMEPAKKTAPFDPVRIHSPLGSAVDFILYPLTVCSEQMAGYLARGELDDIRKELEERLEAAKADGCEIAGLGMYTSIVTNNCTSLRTPGIALTSGNALTISMGIQAIERAVRDKGDSLEDTTAVVVGAAGNIASTYASLLAERTTRIILLGSERGGSLNRLHQTVHSIYDDAWREICTLPRDQLGLLAARLAEEPLVEEWLRNGSAPQRHCGKTIAAWLTDRYGSDPWLQVSTDRSLVRRGQVVLCAANHPEPFLGAEDFREGAVVCDIAVPNNVMPDIARQRPDIIYQQGGIVATPNGESLHASARAFLGPGQLFACMAETVVLGLAGFDQHYSYGAISKQQVREISLLAEAHGFRLADYKKGSSL